MSRREQLESLLTEDPHDPFLHYALAQEFAKEGVAAEAITRLETMNRNFPDYVPAYFRLGQILAEEDQSAAARQILQTGIQVARKVGDLHAAGEMSQLLEILS